MSYLCDIMLRMIKGVLIGNPVSNSISHITHNEIFRANGIVGFYEKKHIEICDFDKVMYEIKKSDYRFISVTMPFKESVIRYLDEIDSCAKKIGAVNLINVCDGKWIGYNTDSVGAGNAIEKHIPVNGKTILLLGAGGTARAIAYEMTKRGAYVFVYNRTYEKALSLGTNFGATPLKSVTNSYDILINATSVGMFPNTEVSPIKGCMITPGAFVMDVVYRPHKTKLLRLAEERGCTQIYGLEMFFELSYLQFEIVFGRTFIRYTQTT